MRERETRFVSALTAKASPAGGLSRCHPCTSAGSVAAGIRSVWLAAQAEALREVLQQTLNLREGHPQFGQDGHGVLSERRAAAGTYYDGACVDAVAGESDTTNNCSGSVQVVVE